MLNFMQTLHLLAAIVWVGGMFFAHMAMRPVVTAQLEPPQRLPLLHGVLGRFFPWVWISILLLLGTGYGIFLGVFQGQMGLYVHLMQGLGLVMMGLFLYIYFVPYQQMGTALEQQDIPAAAAAMNRIRGIIATNLVLGLITSAVASSRLF